MRTKKERRIDQKKNNFLSKRKFKQKKEFFEFLQNQICRWSNFHEPLKGSLKMKSIHLICLKIPRLTRVFWPNIYFESLPHTICLWNVFNQVLCALKIANMLSSESAHYGICMMQMEQQQQLQMWKNVERPSSKWDVAFGKWE